MKKHLAALILSASLAFAPMTMASKSIKIGVLDVHKVMQKTSEPKQIEETMKKEFQPKMEEVQAMEKKLREDIEKLQRDKDILSASEKTKLEKKIQESQQALMAKQSQYSQESQAKQQKMMQEFINKLKKEVEGYAKKEGYDMVLVSDAVPYMAENYDITESIIKMLEDKKG